MVKFGVECRAKSCAVLTDAPPSTMRVMYVTRSEWKSMTSPLELRGSIPAAVRSARIIRAVCTGGRLKTCSSAFFVASQGRRVLAKLAAIGWNACCPFFVADALQTTVGGF
jgi:hypothetical protein